MATGFTDDSDVQLGRGRGGRVSSDSNLSDRERTPKFVVMAEVERRVDGRAAAGATSGTRSGVVLSHDTTSRTDQGRDDGSLNDGSGSIDGTTAEGVAGRRSAEESSGRPQLEGRFEELEDSLQRWMGSLEDRARWVEEEQQRERERRAAS